MQVKTLLISAIVGFGVFVSAHPGEHEERDVLAEFSKREYKASMRHGLEKCSAKFEADDLNARAVNRRAATVEMSVCLDAPETVIFQSNNTCVLNLEGETGPYWVKGKLIRSDVREGQAGVEIVLDGQFVDVETCEPIVGLYWDIWNCNSTGVYSGVVANGNGNSADTSNYNTTFLRGLQPTDDGVAQFRSVFPGHYAGRATHHVIAYLNVTVLPNNTLTGGTVALVGQLFWDIRT